ncbi:MAG: nucleoside deaminase [Clostridia bacterium]|nr:nucleoside deaminase [Clostridia bacterium]
MTKEKYMFEALKEAEKALKLGEVPIGAVIVKDGVIIGRGHNKKECLKDATNHAEMIAIKEASVTIGGWRLTGCQMYVTIEPCVMCAGAIYQTRIDKVVIGARDIKAGAVESLYHILSDERLNHIVDCEFGILEDEAREIMQRFFQQLRRK